MIKGKVVSGADCEEQDVEHVFASDLMSDVLTIKNADNLLLITGLCNMQTIRTCEMAEVKELAAENEMLLIETDYSMYRCSGILYQAGLPPLY